MAWQRVIAASIVWAMIAVGFASVMAAIVSFIRLELFNPFTSTGGRVMLVGAGLIAAKLMFTVLKDDLP